MQNVNSVVSDQQVEDQSDKSLQMANEVLQTEQSQNESEDDMVCTADVDNLNNKTISENIQESPEAEEEDDGHNLMINH